VLAVGNESFFMVHELAFVGLDGLVRELRDRLGEGLAIEIATNRELPVGDAVAAYPFNSQVLTLPDGSMTIVAPEESRENGRARAFLERVVAADNPVRSVSYLDLRQSMNNGGGPACLRLRVPLTDEEVAAVGANVFFGPELDAQLVAWVERHYRDRVLPGDLRDPAFCRENMTALDELTRILKLGSVYDFQRG
jgi:succinylarginine dihydrolase